MMSSAREEDNSDSDCSEGIVTKDGEGRKQAVFEFKGVLFPDITELGNMMTRISGRKARHVSICKEDVPF